MYALRSDRFGRTSIARLSDGALIPEDAENRDYCDYLAWVEAGGSPGPSSYQPTAANVRAEASRRMQALVGARDAAHLEIIIANGTREAVRMLRKGAQYWTDEERARAAELEALDTAFEAIRAASNAMEPSPPADYASDERWP